MVEVVAEVGSALQGPQHGDPGWHDPGSYIDGSNNKVHERERGHPFSHPTSPVKPANRWSTSLSGCFEVSSTLAGGSRVNDLLKDYATPVVHGG